MGKILVAEDESDIAALVELVLGMAGHDVTVVGDGADALEQLAAHRFDLLVTDDRMPRVTGHAVIARVRSTERLRRLPIVSVSGSARPPAPDAEVQASADAYLSKPFDIDELVATVDALVAEPGT